MPFGVRKRGSRWEIYNKKTGTHKGWSNSERDAHISASIANKESGYGGKMLLTRRKKR